MRPNVILIVCDSLRKSIMERYGGPAKMPNLDRFAKDSMVYDNCIAPETWTFPSHTSMFTGMYANEHKVHESRTMKVENLAEANIELRAQRLPEYMQTKGYNTLCISNNFMISRYTGFDYGFDNFLMLESSPWIQSKTATEARHIGADPLQVLTALVREGKFGTILKYANEMERIKKVAKASNYPVDKGAAFTTELLTNATLNEPLFLFINFFEMHEPYVGFSDKDLLDNLDRDKEVQRREGRVPEGPVQDRQRVPRRAARQVHRDAQGA